MSRKQIITDVFWLLQIYINTGRPNFVQTWRMESRQGWKEKYQHFIKFEEAYCIVTQAAIGNHEDIDS